MSLIHFRSVLYFISIHSAFYNNCMKVQKRIFINSHRRCSVRKGVLKNFAKFTRKHLYQSLFFNEVTGLKSATLLKKRLWHKCFAVNFAKFPRTPFLKNTFGRLLLHLVPLSNIFAVTFFCENS